MASPPATAAPLPEVARLIASEHRLFIGGAWTEARGGATFEVHDPASGAVVAHVPLASAEDVGDAVAAARAAQPVWEARAVDVPLSAGIFRLYGGLVQAVAGSVLPVSLEGFHAYSRREPVGVVGAIVPWNFRS